MKILDIRDQIWDAVSVIRPLDNTEREHIDYVLKWNPDEPMSYDKDEFNQIRWFEINEIPFERSDPHLRRFIEKMMRKINS